MQKYESAFGKNDIRGIYGEDITEELFFNIGKSFTIWLSEQSKKSISDIYITIAHIAHNKHKEYQNIIHILSMKIAAICTAFQA